MDRITSDCETTGLHFFRSRKQSLVPCFAECDNRYTAFLNLPNPRHRPLNLVPSLQYKIFRIDVGHAGVVE